MITYHDDSELLGAEREGAIPPGAPRPARQLKPRQLWQDGWAVLRARWYLRAATSLGPKTRVWGRVAARNNGRLVIGDRVRLVGTIVPIDLSVGSQGTLEIGEGAYINYGCSIGATMRVSIGARALIGTYVIMMDNDFHQIEPERRYERPPSAPIVIEDDVWIGARAVVLRGVRIGAGSVIAAGSVVTRDVPPRSLAAGVPARVIREL